MKKMLIIGGAALVLLGGGGAGAAYFLGLFPSHASGPPKPVIVPPKPILFAALADVVVSVPDDAGDPPSDFVQFAVQFATTDPNAVTGFTAVQPIIKSQIISLLMAQTGKALEDPATRAALTQNCLDISNNALTHDGNYTAGTPFSAAYITNLVVQN